MQLYQNNIQDKYGTAIAGASVRVVNAETGELAALYSDNGTTPLFNPITAGGVGEFTFYAPNGRYTFTATSPGVQAVMVRDFELADSLEIVAAVAGGAASAAADALTASDNAALTALDRAATGADRVQTGQDRTAAADSATTASTQAGIATTKSGEALASKNAAGQSAIDANAIAVDLQTNWGDKLVTATAKAAESTASAAAAALSAGLAEAAANAANAADVIVGPSIPLISGFDHSYLVKSGGPAYVELVIPASGQGDAIVRSADGSGIDIAIVHKAGAVRLGNSGSSIVLPSVTLPAAADVGWTIGVLVRINDINTQTGTTHHSFLKIGTGAAYMLMGYEGPNATNPGCIKLLMPNAAASGLVSLRSNASPTPSGAAFAPANIGQYVWVFVRKTGAAVTETLLSQATGLPISTNFSDETITLAWGNLQADESGSMRVYGGSSGIAGGAYGAATAAVSIGPDASTTGSADIAKVFVLQSFVSAADLNKLVTGKRPQDIGLGTTNATEIYYDFDTLTTASLLDRIGGAAATSVTMAGGDALTPSTDRPITRKYLGNITTAMTVVHADGVGRGF